VYILAEDVGSRAALLLDHLAERSEAEAARQERMKREG
jgi:hypothetical protein